MAYPETPEGRAFQFALDFAHITNYVAENKLKEFEKQYGYGSEFYGIVHEVVEALRDGKLK